jgi:hypothetical protein
VISLAGLVKPSLSLAGFVPGSTAAKARRTALSLVSLRQSIHSFVDCHKASPVPQENKTNLNYRGSGCVPIEIQADPLCRVTGRE